MSIVVVVCKNCRHLKHIYERRLKTLLILFLQWTRQFVILVSLDNLIWKIVQNQRHMIILMAVKCPTHSPLCFLECL